MSETRALPKVTNSRVQESGLQGRELSRDWSRGAPPPGAATSGHRPTLVLRDHLNRNVGML